MRITSGLYRGRPIKAPDGMDIRPTADKVRQAVFNILFGMRLPQDASVLDGFCGTGALGLEALSRGARQCVFLDKADASLACCRANIAAMGAGDRSTVMRLDAAKPGMKPAKADPAQLFFLDPPYQKDLIAPALAGLAAGGWLDGGAVGIVETAKAEIVAADGFAVLDTRTYGSTRITIVQYDAA